MPVHSEEIEDYKTKYKNLKRKLKLLIYVSMNLYILINIMTFDIGQNF